jgi:hypothetical protein
MVGPPREKGGPCIARSAGGWGLGTQAIKFNAACEFAFQELSIVRKKTRRVERTEASIVARAQTYPERYERRDQAFSET